MYHSTSKVIFSEPGRQKGWLRGKTDESGSAHVRCLSRTLIFRSRPQKSCQGWGCHLGIPGTWTVTGLWGMYTVRRGAVEAAKGQRNASGLCYQRSSEKKSFKEGTDSYEVE